MTKKELWNFICAELPDLKKEYERRGWHKDVICLFPEGAQLNVWVNPNTTIELTCMCLGTRNHVFVHPKGLCEKIKEYLSHECIPWGG